MLLLCIWMLTMLLSCFVRDSHQYIPLSGFLTVWTTQPEAVSVPHLVPHLCLPNLFLEALVLGLLKTLHPSKLLLSPQLRNRSSYWKI